MVLLMLSSLVCHAHWNWQAANSYLPSISSDRDLKDTTLQKKRWSHMLAPSLGELDRTAHPWTYASP